MSISESSPEQTPTKQPENLQPSKQTDIFSYPEVRSLLNEIPSLIRENIKTKHDTTRWTFQHAFLWIAIFVIVIIICVSILTWFNKLPPEVISFLFGTIAGSIFTFATRFFG